MKILVNSKTPLRVVLSSGLSTRFLSALKRLVLSDYNIMFYGYADATLAEDLLRWAYKNNVSVSALVLALDHAASTKYSNFPSTKGWLNNYILVDNIFFCRSSKLYKEYRYYHAKLYGYSTIRVGKKARVTRSTKTKKANKHKASKAKKELVVKLPKNSDINSIRIKLV